MENEPSSSLVSFRHSLTFKVFLTALLCSLMFVGLSTLLQVWMSFQAETKKIRGNVQFIKKSYLPSIADSLYKLDEPQIRLLLRGVIQLKGVEQCEVRYNLGGENVSIAEGSQRGRGNIEHEFPIQYKSQKNELGDIGKLIIRGGHESYWQHFWHLRPLTIFINAFQILIIALIMLIIFQSLISRHLSAMAKYARKLSIDNLKPVLKLDRRTESDELEIVVNAINDLRERLEQDIEKQSRQELELKLSYERFSVVMDSLDAAVYVADMQSHEILFANRYVQDHWGTVVGSRCWEKLQNNQTGPCSFCTNDKLVDENGNPTDIYIWEYQNTRNDIWYECRDQAIRWMDGTIVRLEVATDITERKTSEDEKAKLQARLQQAQKMQAIGTLASGIAHDFNNILSGIFSFAHLAKKNKKDPEKVSENIDHVITGGQKAADLVRQILTVSRQSDDEKRSINMKPVVKEALKLLQASLPSTIKIEQNVISQSLIMADPTKIHQIVMNLCTNAYHAMINTGGTLSVTLQETEVKNQGVVFGLEMPEGRYVKLAVTDTGHGIDPEILKQIFDPYFTTKPIGKGTGLGLAIVAGIVEEHNGYLKVNSEPGHGSTFQIYFPVVENESNFKPLEEKIVSPKGGSETLMFVDDEKEIRTPVSKILENNGYTVCSFKDGREAFKEYKKEPDRYDLIISDMTMPEMTGLELSKKIFEIKPDQKIFICTGFSEAINKDKARAIGISKYIEKPFVIGTLLKEIRAALEKNEI